MRKFPKKSLKKGVFRPKTTQKREKSFFFAIYSKKVWKKFAN